MSDVLSGGSSYVALLENLVEDPEPPGRRRARHPDQSQIDRLEKLDPDVAFTTDLMGNDMDMAVIGPTICIPRPRRRWPRCRRASRR